MKFQQVISVLLLGVFLLDSNGQDPSLIPLGKWGSDEHQMPYFSYEGELPYKASLKNGEDAFIDDDPYFLLGNYRFKLFAHVSGEYELVSTERVISRLNTKENTRASIVANGKEYQLTGTKSLAADPEISSRVFGTGFAEYSYHLPGLECKRIFSVLPSKSVGEGYPGFRITVSIKNTGKKKQKIAYQESIRGLYDKITNTEKHDDLNYEMSFTLEDKMLAKGISSILHDESLFPLIHNRDEISYNEYYPPVLFMKLATEGNGELVVKDDVCSAMFNQTLKAGEEVSYNIIIGYNLENSTPEIMQISDVLMALNIQADFNSALSKLPVSKEWSSVVNLFPEEKDPDLQRELIWHNYVLESLATHSDYFKETFIPQGCMYLFSWGLQAAPRDENQHALAACYTNPELAKSTLRYILKKSDIKGNIPFNNLGHGVVTSKFYQTSDQQLFFFLLLSEYLRITGDYSFLMEEVGYYPVNNAPKQKVIYRVGEYYRYLLEEVGLGPHGLICLGNSDWNDIVFYRMDTKYNANFYSNESLMNTTMAVSILPNLVSQLRKGGALEGISDHKEYIQALSSHMDDFREKLWKSFLDDHGDRTFAKRMYFNQKAVGVENMFLEPQGFLMQIEEYGLDRKEALYDEIQDRILLPEKTGARQEEKMELSESHFGSRENGGIWYSLNGPLILGLASWNQDAAWNLFHRLTLKHQSEMFPQYWSCYWSSFDATESSIRPGEGLHAQHITWSPAGTKYTYCAHIHAWLVYSYKYMKELEKHEK